MYKGEEIKIGTCEMMYYLRYEDRFKVRPLPHNIDPGKEVDIFFRLPLPQEDHLQPGDYPHPAIGVKLCSQEKGYFVDKTTVENHGLIQVSHKPSGFLATINCYHGLKLPESTKEARFFYNGKTPAFELIYLKITNEGVRPVIQCAHCGHLWSYDIADWEEILEYVMDEQLKERLQAYLPQMKSHLHD